MRVKELHQIAANLFQSAHGDVYQHKIGIRYRQEIDGDGMEKTVSFNVSEGLVRVTPRRHVKRRTIKDDMIKKGLREDGRVKRGHYL